MLVLAYTRVSSIEQESGFGLEIQELAARQLCKEKGLPAPEIVTESISGESLAVRVGLQDAIARCEEAVDEGREAHLLVYSLDRLARDLIDQETIVNRAFVTKVHLHSTQAAEAELLDPEACKDPARVMLRQMLGAFAQWEKSVIQRRLDAGLARKAAAGGFTGGRPPFGYRIVNRDLEIDPGPAAAVLRVLRLKDMGLNQSTISAVMGAEYPGMRRWGGSAISWILSHRDLYEKGLFKPSRSEEAVQRPELALKAAAEDAPIQVDWGRIEYPLELPICARLLGTSQKALFRMARDEGTRTGHLIRQRRDRMYLDKPLVDSLRKRLERRS